MMGACLMLMLGACAAGQSQALLQHRPASLPVAAHVDHVPFFAQSEFQCGPAAQAMMLSWAGKPLSPEQLSPGLFIPDKNGSLQIEMLAMPLRYGMLAYPLAPKLADLLGEGGAGHPVLVFQNLALSWYPQWHYAVVIGYDLHDRTITLHSGQEAEHRIPLSTFEHTWARAGYWAMLSLPPDTLPARVDEARLMQAAVSLEQASQPQAAAMVYQAALQRWPLSLTARMGRGNSYYSLGQLDKAGQAFYQATIDHPDAAAAYNNLAQVYFEQGRKDDARDAIRQAMHLDGESQLYRNTQDAIRNATGNGYGVNHE